MSNFKSFIIYSIGFFSLLLGLFLNENSSGGAKIDFSYLFPFIESFRSSFEGGLQIFINNSASIIHSPVFYILISFIYKLISNSGPKHKPRFIIAVKIKNTAFIEAEGASKKLAQQAAATKLLKLVENNK